MCDVFGSHRFNLLADSLAMTLQLELKILTSKTPKPTVAPIISRLESSMVAGQSTLSLAGHQMIAL